MNINTQQMRYFMELAKCLNFTRAAANLYVAQPTLSQQIAELESQLGVSLFVRSSRSVTLTAAGKILQSAYPDFLARMEQVQQQMRITAAGFSGSLTIGFLEIFIEPMSAIIRNFKSEFPDVAVKPVHASLNNLNSRLKAQTIDVAMALIQDFAPEDQAGFKSKVILRDALCFVLPGDHPVSSDYSFTASMPLVALSHADASCYYPYINNLLKKLGIQVPEVIFADSPIEIQAYLESGIGFSVLPSKLAISFSPSTQFIPISGEYLTYGVLWDPSSANPALPLFLDALDRFLEPDTEADTPEGG